MSRLTRYILGELTKIFLLVLIGMTTLMMLAGVVQETVRQGLGLISVLRLMPYLLPNALCLAIPATTLFAACSLYGRMSSDNEVLAVKSLGISPLQCLLPALVFAFFLSLSAVWLNDVARSWGRRGMNRVILQSLEQIIYGMLQTNRSYRAGGFSINVMDVHGHRLIEPTLSFHGSGEDPAVTLTAREAELRLNVREDTLTIIMVDTEIDADGQWRGDLPGQTLHEVPLTMASRQGKVTIRASDCPLGELPRRVAEHERMLEQTERDVAAQAALHVARGDLQGLTGDAWNQRFLKLEGLRYELLRMRAEPWRRWSNGFSCFFFVMLGAPLAVRMRNSDVWTTFGVCFLPILLLYYPLLMAGTEQAKSGQVPPYAVWTGNVVLMCVGLWQLRRVRRY